MKNENIVKAWISGQSFSNKRIALSTNGHDLFSYNKKIGYTNDQGKKVVIDYTSKGGYFISMTTSQHVSLAMNGYGDIWVKNPNVDHIEIPLVAYNPKAFK